MVNINNLVIAEGRISTDINYSSFTGNDGQPVSKARFNIALDRQLSKDKRQEAQNGGNVKTADFMPVNMTGEMVDKVLKPWFHKGKGIRILGHYTEWQQKDSQTGETKYGHAIEVDFIGFCIQDPKNANNGNGGQQNNPPTQQSAPQPQSQPQQNPNSNFSMFDDEDNQPF